ncbi:MAG TPA: Asp-tRNA(Asn)/Glu-tRNA(Gln) amidotransferase subunit GatC [Symbiobacteriaceae bacterium]|nr:Asp-tRNA(Asn)/Glu-tRNA(Gln) amidotransferase subunit GatC [Symbiobacteriaceae bacterium]
MALTRSQVEHVARLARLALTEAEKEMYLTQLSRILDHVESMNRLDTSHVPPTYQAVALQNVLRGDEPHQSLDREKLLSQAPDHEAGCFKVPKITEG